MLIEQSVQRQLTANEQLYLQETGQDLGDRTNLKDDVGYKQWMLDLTNNILDGVFPRSGVDNDNQEALKYLYKHPIKKLNDENGILMLFDPIDSTKFEKCCTENLTYHPNNFNPIKDELYTKYYLNNIKNLEFIFSSINKICADKENPKPFKIAFDCGFVVEDTVKEEYSISLPAVDKLGRNVPMTIKGPADVELFKHLVFSTLSDFTSEVHLVRGSRYHYVALHCMLFQVTKLAPSAGARVLVPGYDFLIKNKFIRDWGNDNNLCMFNVVANFNKK